MKKLLIILVLLFVSNVADSQELWVNKDGNINNIDGRDITVSKDGIYLATRNELYHARSLGEKWESLFYIPGPSNEINCAASSPEAIFIGTNKGLFRSHDNGASWKNAFKTINRDKSDVLALALPDTKTVLLGTGSGVFMSPDGGNKWKDISGVLKNTSVKSLSADKGFAYAGTDSGLYMKDLTADYGWERLIIKSPVKENPESEDGIAELEEFGEELGSVNCIASGKGRIYAGVGKEILYSEDKGKTWKGFKSEGIGGFVNHILPTEDPSRIYSATTKGVFEYMEGKQAWSQVYKGMEKSPNVLRLAVDKEEKKLISVTGKGIYILEQDTAENQYADVEKTMKTFNIYSAGEPSFNELRQAAIDFAEVSPEKIKKWRRESKLRALFPKVSVGWDKDISNTSEIYTSGTRDYVVVGPDDIKSGLDFSVSWELGDLIWSDDQTNIDVRSRLMVQLRNDILEELRRLYYERKRIQFELMMQPPKDLKSNFDKELRLQELTSAIDDLTGNYLSTHTKKSG